MQQRKNTICSNTKILIIDHSTVVVFINFTHRVLVKTYLTSTMDKFLQFILVTLEDCCLGITNTCAHCVDYECQEIQSRSNQDSKPQLMDMAAQQLYLHLT